MKRIINAILIISGIFLIFNTAVLAVVTNYNFGLVMTFSVGAAILLYGIYSEKIHAVTKRGFLKWMRYCVYAICLFVCFVIIYISVFGQIDTVTYNEDALIVLGAGINGENITYPLLHRLNKAIDYIGKNPNAVIVVSGGQGYQEDITEALAMERYLVKKGIDKSKIIKEEKATSTFENFAYSKEILDSYFNKPYKTAFITNNFHIYRASRLAKITGYNSTHLHAKIEWYTIPINYLREFTAILKLWLLKR